METPLTKMNNVSKCNKKINLLVHTKKLERELELIYREFNSVMRLFYENNSLLNSSIQIKRKKKVAKEQIIVEEHANTKMDTKLRTKKKLDREIKLDAKNKKTKKKKRPIIWNPWVIDSSSESSDSDC
jgi:hypothetical protein